MTYRINNKPIFYYMLLVNKMSINHVYHLNKLIIIQLVLCIKIIDVYIIYEYIYNENTAPF